MLMIAVILVVVMLPLGILAQPLPDYSEGVLIYDQGGIRAEAFRTLDNDYCVFIRNNTDRCVDELQVVIQYLDGGGKVAGYDQDWHNALLPGSTVVSKMRRPREYAQARLDVVWSAEREPSFVNRANNVVISSYASGNALSVEVRNAGMTEIREIEYAVVFYFEDEVSGVSYAKDLHHVKAGETVSSWAYPPREYDRYEVFLNQAHTALAPRDDVVVEAQADVCVP